MKRIPLAITFAMIILSLTGCGLSAVEDQNTNIVQNPQEEQQQVQTQPAAVQTETAANTQTDANIPTAKENETKPNTTEDIAVTADENTASDSQKNTAESSGLGIVAKSNNPVSSAEKEEVFDNVDSEINDLIASLDNMDAVKEPDLQFDSN